MLWGNKYLCVKNWLRKLNEPFPEEENLGSDIKHITATSLFIFFILFVLKPFNIHAPGSDYLWVCLGFAAVTFVVSFLYFVVFRYLLKLKKDAPSWTLGRWIIYMLGLLMCIAWGNLLYIRMLNPYAAINLSNFMEMAFSTLVIGWMPVVFSGFVIQLRAEHKNKKEASGIQQDLKEKSPETQMLTVASANLKQQLTVPADSYLYFEAQQNYVVVWYSDPDKPTSVTLRNTLKSISAQIPEQSFFRCHQSFIVNLSRIEQVSGNAQGLRLKLKNLPQTEVPVSRRYVSSLKEKLV